jgi:hypothetical protein
MPTRLVAAQGVCRIARERPWLISVRSPIGHVAGTASPRKHAPDMYSSD